MGVILSERDTGLAGELPSRLRHRESGRVRLADPDPVWPWAATALAFVMGCYMLAGYLDERAALELLARQEMAHLRQVQELAATCPPPLPGGSLE